MHSNCKQNIYEFTKICCNVLNFSLAHKSAQLFMGVAALIEPQAGSHLPPLSDYPLNLTLSPTLQLLSSVYLSVFSVAIFVINCLHIFLPFCQFSTTHHVICTDHLTPLSPSPSPLSTPVSVLSAAPSNWRPALCHAPHCRLICRVCCCCTCHSLSLLHIYI